MKRREIPFITIGRLRRIPVAALERFIEQKLREEFPDATV
jgi:excisionase family DNA binding protein